MTATATYGVAEIAELFPNLMDIQCEELRSKVAATWNEAITTGCGGKGWTFDELRAVKFTLLAGDIEMTFIEHLNSCVRHRLGPYHHGHLLNLHDGHVNHFHVNLKFSESHDCYQTEWHGQRQLGPQRSGPSNSCVSVLSHREKQFPCTPLMVDHWGDLPCSNPVSIPCPVDRKSSKSRS